MTDRATFNARFCKIVDDAEVLALFQTVSKIQEGHLVEDREEASYSAGRTSSFFRPCMGNPMKNKDM